MIIQSANVSMQGSSSYTSVQKLDQRQLVIRMPVQSMLRELRNENRMSSLQEQLKKLAQEDQEQDSLSLSDKGTQMAKSTGVNSGGMQSAFSGDWLDEAKLVLIRSILDQLGLEGSDINTESLRKSLQDRLDNLNNRFQRYNRGDGMRHLQPIRIGGANLNKAVLTMKTTSTVSIENSMSFSAQASVKTADGREINIDMNLNMSQSYYEKVETKLEAVFKDPLVINLNATSAQLRDTKFDFDLDCDGASDQISQLMSGSGFLALDKNGDGVVNDGSELFGATTGNGFAELASYDSDRNGWIDEADDVFDKLRVWIQNDDGTSSLVGLGQAGVGAIFLGSVGTDYALGSLADPDGMIRSTGMFLFEDGRSGTVQHIDLAI